MVAQYAVLEDNAKVNGKGQISQPTLPKPLNQFRWRFKYIIMSAQGVNVQNLAEIDSAVMNLHMREKNAFSCGFFG